MITGDHIRKARELLGWTVANLMNESGVSRASINRVEREGHKGELEEQLIRTLEAAGVIFDGGEPGVKLSRAGSDRE